MGRLKRIPKILSPELLHTIASMGHGDEIVLADSNFPAASCCTEGEIKVWFSSKKDLNKHSLAQFLIEEFSSLFN